jgi:hypothetical protein
MAWRKKLTKDMTTSVPLNRLATPKQISSYIKKIVNANVNEYHESESLEVSKVLLNDELKHGAILGTFINDPSQPILGDVILPLMPNISQIPLIGEHVVVVEYNGQHYYTSIINRKNNPNENAIPGVSVEYDTPPKYGKTFARDGIKGKKIRRVELNEGEISYEGRFGNSITLGCNPQDNSAAIKLRVGQADPPRTEEFRKNKDPGANYGFEDVSSFGLAPVAHSIDMDVSSIYLLENGLPTAQEKGGISGGSKALDSDQTFNGGAVIGPAILMKSSAIRMSGRQSIDMKAPNVNLFGKNILLNPDPGGFVKLGSNVEKKIEPLVLGDGLVKFLEKMIDKITDSIDGAYFRASTLYVSTAPGAPVVGAAAAASFKTEMIALKSLLKIELTTAKDTKTGSLLSKTVKTL